MNGIARQRGGAANQEFVREIIRSDGLAIPVVEDIRRVLVPIDQGRRLEAIEAFAIALAD